MDGRRRGARGSLRDPHVPGPDLPKNQGAVQPSNFWCPLVLVRAFRSPSRRGGGGGIGPLSARVRGFSVKKEGVGGVGAGLKPRLPPHPTTFAGILSESPILSGAARS